MKPKRSLAKTPRSDRRLSRFSEKHVRYEVQMLFTAGVSLHPHQELTVFDRNILVEAFGLHLRSLIEFLYGESRRKNDDVGAEEYVADRNAWTRARRAMPPGLAAAKRRADKQMAHLTTKRYSHGKKKAWPVTALMADIAAPLRVFAQHAKKGRLHRSVRALIRRLP